MRSGRPPKKDEPEKVVEARDRSGWLRGMRARRIEAGLTQAEVGLALGTTPQAVSLWERGLHNPSIKEMIALAGVLGCTVGDLMDGGEDRTRLAARRRSDRGWLAGLRRARRAAGLTQTELAGRMGTTPQAVSTWETGRSCPSLATMSRLAGELGCGVDDLIDAESQ